MRARAAEWQSRLAHILLEIHKRQTRAIDVIEGSFRLPFAQLIWLTGLTNVSICDVLAKPDHE